MKKYKQILKEVTTLQGAFNIAAGQEKKRLEREYQKIKPELLILETNPKESTLQKQLKEQQHKLEIIESRYDQWAETNASKHDNPLKAYRLEMGVSTIKTRINTLSKILNEKSE